MHYLFPGHGFGSVALRGCEQVHPLRGPGHRPVGLGVAGMQDDGQLLSGHLSGKISGTCPYGKPVLFQLFAVDPCERVKSPRIYDSVVPAFDAVPLQSAGVVSHRIELGLCHKRKPQQHQYNNQFMEILHIALQK